MNYTPYYQLTDHLGSVRTVFTLSSGRPRIVAQNDYYAFGLRHTTDVLSHGSSTDNRYLFNGKEDQVLGSLGLLDYGARMYDPLAGRWFNMDPLAEKYHGISPVAYCANNPVNIIDRDGRDIVVLRNSADAHNTGHAALLVGNDNKRWTYISKDGYTGNAITGSKSKYVVTSFNSIDLFEDSPHNFVLNSGTHSTTSGTEAGNFDFQFDADGNKVQRYDEALLIETTQADGSSTDSAAIDSATASAKSDYKLMVTDCSYVVTSALDVSKDKKGKQVKNGEQFGALNERPNSKFNKIEKRNPDASRIDDKLRPTR